MKECLENAMTGKEQHFTRYKENIRAYSPDLALKVG